MHQTVGVPSPSRVDGSSCDLATTHVHAGRIDMHHATLVPVLPIATTSTMRSLSAHRLALIAQTNKVQASRGWVFPGNGSQHGHGVGWPFFFFVPDGLAFQDCMEEGGWYGRG